MALSGDLLNLVDLGLNDVPQKWVADAANVAKSLNLSENAIKFPTNLAAFKKVHTLILDKNNLASLDGFPTLPSLTTLWFNNNAVESLPEFLDQVETCFPNLTYLSLMRNPASPPLVATCEEDVQTAQRYRLYVVYRLPRLQYLDSTPVTGEERREAAARGQFLVVRKPKTKSSSLLKSPVATEGPSNAQVSRSGLYTGLHMSKSAAAGAATSVASVAGSIFAAFASSGTIAAASSSSVGSASSPSATASTSAGPAQPSAPTRSPAAYLGLGKGTSSRYDGRNSEGNRFISDRDL